MKRTFAISLIMSLLFSALIGTIFGPVIGALSFASSLIPKGKSVAMMGLQREVWLPSLQEKYEQKRDWMNELSDLSQFVDESQIIHFAEIGDYPTVYKNRNDDIDAVEPTETPGDVELDTYDSQNYKIRKIGLYGIPYAKVEAYTRQSATAIRLKEAKATAWAITPNVDSEAGKKVILATSGVDLGTGYLSIRIEDIQKLARSCDNLKFPEAETGRCLVLTSNMWWELVMSNEILKAQIGFRQEPGTIQVTGSKNVDVVYYYGFKIFRYDAEVGFDMDANAKAAEGTVIAGNVVPLSFAFFSREAWKGEGVWSMFDKPIQTNTSGRAYEFGFQHRFKAGLMRTAYKYSAGIYSPIA